MPPAKSQLTQSEKTHHAYLPHPSSSGILLQPGPFQAINMWFTEIENPTPFVVLVPTESGGGVGA